MSSVGRLILAVNPGGTSTKTGLFRETELLFEENIRHLPEELALYPTTFDQMAFRAGLVMESMGRNGHSIQELTAVVGRGGAFKPMQSGTYRVNGALVEDVREGSSLQADHPSNLGALIAWEIAEEAGIPAYIVDPVCVDEMIDEARLSGLPSLPRVSLSHALNIRMVAYKAAEVMGKPLNELNMVVLHLGSGISVNALRRGRMIDTSNANDGGPFSPQRVGSLPTTGLVRMCLSDGQDWSKLKKVLLREGGLKAYTGTDHVGEAFEAARNGDARSDLALRAMAYQIAKEAGAMATTLHGEVDALVITGGIAYNDWMVKRITESAGFLGKVLVFPGEEELEALSLGVLRVLDGIETEREYR